MQTRSRATGEPSPAISGFLTINRRRSLVRLARQRRRRHSRARGQPPDHEHLVAVRVGIVCAKSSDRILVGLAIIPPDAARRLREPLGRQRLNAVAYAAQHSSVDHSSPLLLLRPLRPAGPRAARGSRFRSRTESPAAYRPSATPGRAPGARHRRAGRCAPFPFGRPRRLRRRVLRGYAGCFLLTMS
jgi:hypothetical protein